MALKLAVDTIKLETIRYQKLSANDDDTEEFEEEIKEENEDYRWFQRSLCCTLSIITITVIGLMLFVPRHDPYHQLRLTTQRPPTTTLRPPVFVRPKEVANLNCSADFNSYRKHRITISDPKNETDLSVNCKSIHKRHFFQLDHRYPEEHAFPIAYARAVYTDYLFLEMDLAISYSPQNFYCYAIDSNASPLFHQRMHALADCFPNVFLTKHEFHMDSAGHNMGYSHRECMLVLAKPELKWNYLNHDVPLKTNQELVQIFKWYDGANDISANSVPWERVNKNSNWSFEALHLFKNETRNILPFKGYEPILRLAKSLVQVSVSRAMIDFIINDLDLSGLLKNIEWKAYGIDELLMGSLNSADAVNAPGGFTHYCLNHHAGDSSMTRLTIWMDGKAKCPTKWRHWICLFGVEHLHDLKSRAYLFANKFLPSFDFGAIVCWYEELFRRRHYDRGQHRLNSTVYLNLPHVRFNRERKKLGEKFNVTQFACKR